MAGPWRPGPRLDVGQRPVATTVVDLNGNGIPDILCVNQDSNSVTLLVGLGGGFFDDVNPPTFATGQAPVQALVGKFGPTRGLGLIVLNSGSNDMTYYPNIASANTLHADHDPDRRVGPDRRGHGRLYPQRVRQPGHRTQRRLPHHPRER